MTCKLLLLLTGCFSSLQVYALEITEEQYLTAFAHVFSKSYTEGAKVEAPLINVCDAKFYVPSEEDFKVFVKDFYNWLDKNKVLKPANSFDCDKYTMAFKLFANIQFHNGKFGKSKIKDATAETVSISEIQYKIDGPDEKGNPRYHAINMIIFSKIVDGKEVIQLGFFDPQLLNFVKLSSTEILSIYHVRI